MIKTFHVLTPFNRFENLSAVIHMLSLQRSPAFELRWHPIFNDDLNFAVHFPQSWITPGFCPRSQPFWSCWADALNRFISSAPLEPEQYYCILNDDDAYEPGFFDKVNNCVGEVVVVGMKRGHQTPAGVAPERAHGCGTLEGKKELMIPGLMGAEQVITTGRIWEKYGFENRIDADGYRIMAIGKEHADKVVCLPEAFVLFNWFEPGRWNK